MDGLSMDGLSMDGLSPVMAEREGFEPSIRFHVYALSRGAPSATRPSLQNGRNNSTHEEKWQG